MSQRPGKPAGKAEREQRLAAALRENLKRRKQQARAKSDEKPDSKAAKPARDG
jgi:hypothetical protein